jgi:hypothetical protein
MFGIDLGDLFRAGTRLTWRRLGVLIEHLPPESATKTALRDELDDGTLSRLASAPRRGHGPWSHVELLLAAVHDSIERLIYVQYQRAGAKNVKAPEPMPRPVWVGRRCGRSTRRRVSIWSRCGRGTPLRPMGTGEVAALGLANRERPVQERNFPAVHHSTGAGPLRDAPAQTRLLGGGA